MSELMGMLMFPVELPMELDRQRVASQTRPIRVSATTTARRCSDRLSRRHTFSMANSAASSSQEPLILSTYTPMEPVEYIAPAQGQQPTQINTYRKNSSGTIQPKPPSLGAFDTTLATLSTTSGMSDGESSRKRAESKSSAHTITSPSKGPPQGKPSFVYMSDRKHHAFDVAKAPYPLSYEKMLLDLDQWDHVFWKNMKKSVSFVEFNDLPPETCLDLGCGTGVWIIDAAREWPKCEFVGFDLVPLQPPLKYLPPSIAERIKWVQGNFLTGRLPFEDDYFDHIHVRGIAKGVSENLWDKLFAEMHRVLAPGGVLEMIEEDILFPTIAPPWDPLLHIPRKKLQDPENPDQGVASSAASVHSIDLNPVKHPHSLIEMLYSSVFNSRFINMRPTSILPSFVSAYFRQVYCPPAINFPLPPPPSEDKPHLDAIKAKLAAWANGTNKAPIPKASLSLPSESIKNASSHGPSSTNTSANGTSHDSAATADTSINSQDSSSSSSSSQSQSKPEPSRRPFLTLNTMMANLSTSGPEVFPLGELKDPALSMHMYRTFQSVIASREAMWEDLEMKRVREEEGLEELGWEEPGQKETITARDRFDHMLDRYAQQMHVRCGLSQSINKMLKWDLPFKDPPTQREMKRMDDERDHMEQYGILTPPPFTESEVSRSIRVFIGYKEV